MRISEFCKKTELSRDTIRFYEKKGILRLKPQQRLANRYKDYSEDDVALLRLVKKAQSFGFKLREIRVWIEEWYHGNISVAQKIDIFKEQIQKIDEKIIELQEIKAQVADKLEEYLAKSSQNPPNESVRP